VSLLDLNILLNTLFSNTLSPRSFLNVTEQVSHPYKTTGRFMFWQLDRASCSIVLQWPKDASRKYWVLLMCCKFYPDMFRQVVASVNCRGIPQLATLDGS
jgi:hypothetical protein